MRFCCTRATPHSWIASGAFYFIASGRHALLHLASVEGRGLSAHAVIIRLVRIAPQSRKNHLTLDPIGRRRPRMAGAWRLDGRWILEIVEVPL